MSFKSPEQTMKLLRFTFRPQSNDSGKYIIQWLSQFHLFVSRNVKNKKKTPHYFNKKIILEFRGCVIKKLEHW